MNLELHPLCTLFPRMAGAEFDSLVADIKSNGLREPITLHDGLILDGGNRFRACIEAGIEPTTRKFDGGNIVTFVLSANLHRRHMTAGQQAAIVASAQDWAQAQPRGGDRGNQHTGGKVQDCTLATSEQRAATSGASPRTQKMADKVTKADPELAKQVAHGEISLPKAVEQITGNRPGAKPKKEEPDELENLRKEIEDLKEWGAENAALAKDLLAENNAMAEIFEADDRLTALTAENKKLREINRILEERIRGLQSEGNEAKRAAQSWKNKFDKLNKKAG